MAAPTQTYLPKVSFLVLTYNQEKYIYDAVMSGCRQDYAGEMEIVVSDDCSSDGTQAEIERAIRENPSPFRIIYNRQPTNQGIGGNMHDGLALCTGDIIVYNDGDDVSLPHRVSYMAEVFTAHPDVQLAATEINWLCNGVVCPQETPLPAVCREYSIIDCLRSKMQWDMWGCTLAYRRAVIDKYPDMLRTTPTSDTWVRLRAYMLGGTRKAIYISYRVCLNYRIHPNQLTNSVNIKKMNRKALSIQYWQDYLYALIHRYIYIYRDYATSVPIKSLYCRALAV